MSCDNCMKHRPDLSNQSKKGGLYSFTCPECQQVYVTGFEGPGGYWMEKEEYDLETKSYALDMKIMYLLKTPVNKYIEEDK